MAPSHGDRGDEMSSGLGTVAAASLAFALGGTLMKPSHGFSRPWPSLAVAILFVVGAALLARAIRTDQLATTYAVGLGLEAVLTVGLGLVVYREHLSAPSACGVLLIATGVAVVRLG
jgi:small multidrug resistance pump